eukprot:COSAG05_NODE_15981_length_356_cov_1.206226_1_plen_53_part_10
MGFVEQGITMYSTHTYMNSKVLYAIAFLRPVFWKQRHLFCLTIAVGEPLRHQQ